MNQIIATAKAPAAIGPYSQAIKAGNTLYTSGQIGLNPVTGELAEGISNQAVQALENLGQILKQADMDYCNVVKTTVFLKDMNDFSCVNEIYSKYFQTDYPARSCVAVAALPKGALFEIECIAVKE